MDKQMAMAERSFEIAKQHIGKKAILIGGGGILNEFDVVEVLDAWTEETNDPHLKYKIKVKKLNLPSGEITIFTPWLYSYLLLPYPDELIDLPIGTYIWLEDRIVKWTGNIAATIYDLPVVAVKDGDKFVKTD